MICTLKIGSGLPDFPNVIEPNGSNSDNTKSHVRPFVTFVLHSFLFLIIVYGKKAFWASVGHMILQYQLWPLNQNLTGSGLVLGVGSDVLHYLARFDCWTVCTFMTADVPTIQMFTVSKLAPHSQTVRWC